MTDVQTILSRGGLDPEPIHRHQHATRELKGMGLLRVVALRGDRCRAHEQC